MDFFVEDLIGSAKSRTLAPISQTTFGDTDIMTMATEEMLSKIVSDIQRVREDFFLSTKKIPLVAGVDRYPIPSRAIGLAFSSLHYLNEQGQIEGSDLTRIDSSRKDEIIAGSSHTKFYIEGDEVVVATPQSSRGFLLFTYPAKPNRLIATSLCAKITSVTVGADFVTFTVDTNLSESLFVGSQVDLISTKAPFLLWADEVEVLAISDTEIQVPLANVVNGAGLVEPRVGDYICPVRTANIPMIPEEFHPVLAQMVAVRILSALGHAEKWNLAKAELKELRTEVLVSIKNRVTASPKRVSAARNPLLRAFGR